MSKAYDMAREQYAELGVDTEAAIDRLSGIPISLHCWQGDDVGGFESTESELGSGLAVTGNYPGKARTPDELRADLEQALSLIPGNHRLNLHAFYLENGGKPVDRNEIGVEHFENWIAWCQTNGLGLDFNPTCFAHPMANDGFTLSHPDVAVRNFWIEHCIAARKIGDEIGRRLGSPCINNFWVPDGYKDTPADRLAPRERLRDSLDTIFAEPLEHNLDSVESKLFGIGSESYVVGSHEFYFGYAQQNHKLLCLDAGHFHPTEMVSEKISACLLWFPELLLHVSRGVRWDSDHVVTQTDELLSITREIIANNAEQRVHIGLDFFDASINRVAAWTIGTRNVCRALLVALLEPTAMLREMEDAADFTGRLALQEELKSLPFGAVWDHYCERAGVPAGLAWLEEIRAYEHEVLSQRC